MTITQYDKFDKFAAEGTHENVLKTRVTYDHRAKGEMPSFYRFVVLETIFDPTLVDDKKAAYYEHQLGVANVHHAKQLPRNTIIGQRVMDGRATAEPPSFLFPFFPPSLSLPCQPGEHVWVMYESVGNKKTDLGYWMCRIVEPGTVEDVNHTHAPRAHDPSLLQGTKDMYDGSTTPTPDFRNGHADKDRSSGDRYTIAETATISGTDEKAYEKLITDTDGGKLSHIEPVPRYRKRPGDTVIEGTNNALIVVGRDRTGPAAKLKTDSAQGQVVDAYPDADVPTTQDGAGSIDIVVGRGQTPLTGGTVVKNSLGFNELDKSKKAAAANEGDPDLVNDRSRVLVSQKTHVDKNFALDGYNQKLKGGSVSGNDSGEGTVIVKTDKARIVGRQDVQLLVTGNDSDNNGLPKDSKDTSKWATVLVRQDGTVYVQPAKNMSFDVETDSASLKVNPNDVQIFASSVKAGDANAKALAFAEAITDLQQIFNSWTPVPNDGGAALKALLTSWVIKQYSTLKLFGS